MHYKRGKIVSSETIDRVEALSGEAVPALYPTEPFLPRFLHLIADSNPASGGPIEAAQRLAAIWIRHGIVHDLMTLEPPGPALLPDYPGQIFQLGEPGGRLPNPYLISRKMVPWLRENAPRYDAVIVSGLWRYLARGARKALVGGPTPYFVFTHGMLDPWFRKTYPIKHLGKQVSWWFAEGPLLKNAANVLFTCEEEMLLAENAFWPYHVNAKVVSYGAQDVSGDAAAQMSAFRAAVPALGDRPFLLFLSRIHRKKGIDLLIDAFAQVAAVNPSLDLVIAGPDQVGLQASLEERARRQGLQARVHFPGMLRGEVKLGAFRAADAFALTSHQENFGIVVAEALACGTPVLISDKVNIWREIEADGAGIVEPDTAEGAKRLLSRFLALDADERLAMRARARHCFVERFDIDLAARRLFAHLQSRIAELSIERRSGVSSAVRMP
jgi:glycosyltransferase involved in cell wall biosynthesis